MRLITGAGVVPRECGAELGVARGADGGGGAEGPVEPKTLPAEPILEAASIISAGLFIDETRLKLMARLTSSL